MSSTLVVVFYDTLFGGSSKTSTVATSKYDEIIQTIDKHPLEHLKINQKISDEFNEYILTNIMMLDINLTIFRIQLFMQRKVTSH